MARLTQWSRNQMDIQISNVQNPIFHSSHDKESILSNGRLTRYVKTRVALAPGMPRTFSRHRLQRKPLVSDCGMHHGTCVTHVPWCISGSLTRGDGENVPGACATLNFTNLARSPCHTNPHRHSTWYFWLYLFTQFVVKCKAINTLATVLLFFYIWE